MKNHWIPEHKYHATCVRQRATVSKYTKPISCKKHETQSSRSKMYTQTTCHMCDTHSSSTKICTQVLCQICETLKLISHMVHAVSWLAEILIFLRVMQCAQWTDWLSYWYWYVVRVMRGRFCLCCALGHATARVGNCLQGSLVRWLGHRVGTRDIVPSRGTHLSCKMWSPLYGRTRPSIQCVMNDWSRRFWVYVFF